MSISTEDRNKYLVINLTDLDMEDIESLNDFLESYQIPFYLEESLHNYIENL